MQIVIEISDEVKQAFDRASNQDIYGCYYDYNSTIGKAIKNGIPLPKGHGELKDMDDIYEAIEGRVDDTDLIMDYIDCQAPTIIEADRSNT